MLPCYHGTTYFWKFILFTIKNFAFWNFFIPMTFRLANTTLTTASLIFSCHLMFATGCGMFGIWHVWDVGRLRCRTFGMWDVEMWDVQEVEYSGWRIPAMWDVWDVEVWGCGMLEMWDVMDVECSGCAMFGMWDVECGMLVCKMPFRRYTMNSFVNVIPCNA